MIVCIHYLFLVNETLAFGHTIEQIHLETCEYHETYKPIKPKNPDLVCAYFFCGGISAENP